MKQAQGKKSKAKIIALSSGISVAVCCAGFIPAIVLLTKDNKKQADVDPMYKQAETNGNGVTVYPVVLAQPWSSGNTLTATATKTSTDMDKYNVTIDGIGAYEGQSIAYAMVRIVTIAGSTPTKGDTVKFNLNLSCQTSSSNGIVWSSQINDLSATWGETSSDVDNDYDGLTENIDLDDNDNEVAGLIHTQTALPFSFKMDYRNLFNAVGLGNDSSLTNKWNDDLAKLGSILSSHVYSPNEIRASKNMIYDYKTEDGLYKQFGCVDYEKLIVKMEDVQVDKNDTVYSEIAHHDMANPFNTSQKFKIVFLSVRGTIGDNEWISNFDIGYDDASYRGVTGQHPDWHNGYNLKSTDVAATRVWKMMFGDGTEANPGYLKKHGIDIDNDNVIFFNCGHSRGGGIANVIGARMEDEFASSKSNLHYITYCYASPFTTNDKTTRGGTKDPAAYNTIHCVVNQDDFVGKVPFEAWKLAKYGHIHTCKIGQSEENKKLYEDEWKKCDPERAKEYAYYTFWTENVDTLPVKQRSEIYTCLTSTEQTSDDYDKEDDAKKVVENNIKIFKEKLHVHDGWYKFEVADSTTTGKFVIKSNISGGALIDIASNLFGPDKEKFDFATVIAVLPMFSEYFGYIQPLATNIVLAAAEGTDIMDVFNHNHAMTSYYFSAWRMSEEEKIK